MSNGENKRLQLIKAMKQDPEILILDNPFIGLDKEGRNILQAACKQLISDGKHLILISSMQDLPDFISHVAVLEEGRIIQTASHEDFQHGSSANDPDTFKIDELSLLEFQEITSEEIITMKDVNISYNNVPILQNINWTVKKGERWCLTGHNGSGKSTLLSLISADNPQAYANQIYLFGKKRGTGESIWDIKKKLAISLLNCIFFLKKENLSSTLLHADFTTQLAYSNRCQKSIVRRLISG